MENFEEPPETVMKKWFCHKCQAHFVAEEKWEICVNCLESFIEVVGDAGQSVPHIP